MIDAANSQFAAADDLFQWVIAAGRAVSALRSWAVSAIAGQATTHKGDLFDLQLGAIEPAASNSGLKVKRSCSGSTQVKRPTSKWIVSTIA